MPSSRITRISTTQLPYGCFLLFLNDWSLLRTLIIIMTRRPASTNLFIDAYACFALVKSSNYMKRAIVLQARPQATMPLTQSPSSNPVSKQRSAQIAADNDNFKSANARLTKDTPVEPIDDNNINILFGLHPKSYALRLVSYVTNGRYGTRASGKSPPTKNFRHFAISPKNILAVLRRLHRGKAAGPELDSLDIFIKLAGCYTRAKKRKTKCDICLEVLANFFHHHCEWRCAS